MAKELALVTGACGFVGSHMVELLMEKGIEVRATDLEKADRTHLNRLGIEFVPSDLTKKETLLPALEGVDYIFDIASLFDYSAPWDLLYKVNVEGARNLCQVALETNPKVIVHWSSGSIYGIPKELPTTETSPIYPSNNYEKSKWRQEQVMLEYHKRYGLPVVVIRPAVIYGPRSKYGVMTPIFMMAKGKLRAIPGSRKTRGSFVHIRGM